MLSHPLLDSWRETAYELRELFIAERVIPSFLATIDLDEILHLLAIAIDRKYQSALWTGKIEGKKSSFTKEARKLFDGTGLARSLESGKFKWTFSEPVCEKARQLQALADEIDDTGTPEQTLNDPQIESWRETARELRELLIAEVSRKTPVLSPSRIK